MARLTQKSSQKNPRTARPTTSKDSKGKPHARGVRRTKAPRRQDPIAPPTPAIIAARSELQEWVAGSWLRRADPLMVTSKLLAVAIREARTFLEPEALTMALAGIGMTPETMDEDDLITCIESLLIDAPIFPE